MDSIDPDDEIVNLIMEDDEETVVTIQSDVDDEESEELVFTDLTGLSEDDSAQTETRSGDDKSGVELSAAEQGTNDSSEAVESGNLLLKAIIESMHDIKPEEKMDRVERDQLRETPRVSFPRGTP